MGFLQGKRILVSGALTPSSLAFGIAKACRREGAEIAMTYEADRVARRVGKLAEQLETDLCLRCDVSDDAQIEGVFEGLGSRWNRLDGFVHAIGFAPAEAIAGGFFDGLSRDAFRIAHDISAYSFPAMVKAARPLMEGSSGSILTLSYIGAVRTMLSYNTMGLAKASLEASVRYMARELGPQNIRVNAISAAPIRTVASTGVATFEGLLANQERVAPLGREITMDDVGNAAAFLLSDLAGGISGQIVYVDGGFSSC